MADAVGENQFGFPADVEVEGGTITANPQPNGTPRFVSVDITGSPRSIFPFQVQDAKALVIKFQHVSPDPGGNSLGAIGYVSNSEANVQDPTKRVELLPGESVRLFLEDTGSPLWMFANTDPASFVLYFER